MQIIKKVLNSSVVLVEDERGVERVLLGKGIGFGANRAPPSRPSTPTGCSSRSTTPTSATIVDAARQIPAEFVELTRRS